MPKRPRTEPAGSTDGAKPRASISEPVAGPSGTGKPAKEPKVIVVLERACLETGKVGTLAGVFMDKPYSQDGSSLQDQVSFGGVYSLALSSDDSTLYVGDYGSVRRLTILGSGGELYTDASTLSISLSQVPSISWLGSVTALALSE